MFQFVTIEQSKTISLAAVFLSLLVLSAGLVRHSLRGVEHLKFHNPELGSLRFEVLSDTLIHFAFDSVGKKTDLEIETSPMVSQKIFAGPTKFKKTVEGFTTARLSVEVSETPFCFAIRDLDLGEPLAQICPRIPGDPELRISTSATHVYGLGEQFTLHEPTFNWLNQVRGPGNEFGNHMVPFAKGFAGNAMFPIAYALGQGPLNFALFVDNTFAQTWDLTAQPWSIRLSGGERRGYFIAGDDLPALRKQYMDLVGKPLVPPRQAFGLWLSEYGFDNWQEMEDKLKTLRQNGFPIRGLVMDLQWFGGIVKGSDQSSMGGLQWDEKHFPDPEKHLAEWKRQGVGVIGIEEPYVSLAVEDRESRKSIFKTLQERSGLVMQDETHALELAPDAWWGHGGMIDFTNPAAADFWHDWKRQPLIGKGFIGHWTDLGEPEDFSPAGRYHLGEWTHAQAQNLYNFFWSESIYRGYLRNASPQRPWILSRSGISGIERFGTGMWSGDLGTNFRTLNAQWVVHSQMSLSGMDYFGSDIGGFHREAKAADENLDELYTDWFAASSFFDVPVRPHTENLCNCKETAPDRIGDKIANLNHIKLREQLGPYYYSLAHHAHLTADPLVAPLVYYDQQDPEARRLTNEKRIGPFLLVAASATPHQKSLKVYLPRGEWINYRTGEKVTSLGQWLLEVPLYPEGHLELPVFAKAGALIAEMDDKEGATFTLRVFPSTNESSFRVIEDDGTSMDYLRGDFRITPVTQKISNERTLHVDIAAAQGTYHGAPDRREVLLKVIGAKGSKLAAPAQGCALSSSPNSPVTEVRCARVSVHQALHVEVELHE